MSAPRADTLGLTLGSGGARGFCHIGVLRVLEEMGVEPEVVVGCSMGALVGAAWAGGKLDALEDWALSLSKARFLQYVDVRLDRGGLVEGKAVTRILQDLGLPERIEDLPKPFLAVATDMTTGREIWLQEGNLTEAVRASVSIPGLFSPVQLDGRWLLDGGLINPVPTSAARALGAHCTIAVNPNAKHDRKLWQPSPEDGLWARMGIEDVRAQLPDQIAGLLPEGKKEVGPGYMDVVSVSIDILTEFLRKSRDAADPPDVLLEADLADISVVEMYRAQDAIDEGRRIAEAAKDRINAVAGRKTG